MVSLERTFDVHYSEYAKNDVFRASNGLFRLQIWALKTAYFWLILMSVFDCFFTCFLLPYCVCNFRVYAWLFYNEYYFERL